MSDSSRVQLYQLKETVLGTTPASAFKELRFTGDTLNYNQKSTVSQEIRQDRQITDLIRVGGESAGAINFELSAESQDDLIEGALQSVWGTTLTYTAATISAAAVDNSINDVGAAFPAFVPGQWIKISGFTGNTANNGYARVVSRTGAKIVVEGLTLVDDAAGESVTVKGTMIRNGTTKVSFSLEKKFADITQFLIYKGMVIGSMDLAFRAQEVLTGSFGLMGISAARAAVSGGTGAAVAANTNPVMNASSNVAKFLENMTQLGSGIFVPNLNLNLNNNVRGKTGIGQLDLVDIGLGQCDAKGSMSVYFADGALYDKFKGNTASGISTIVEDANGKAYIVSMPRIEYTKGDIVTGGNNQDTMVDLEFQAVRHPTYDCTIQIDRF